MGLEDLVFAVQSTGDTIYDPLALSSGAAFTIRITNTGATALTGLGVYIAPATNLGDVDNPSEFPPETDYQDLLTWGTNTDLAVTVSGGMILTLPQNSGPDLVGYVTRTAGAGLSTKMDLKDLAAGAYVDIDVELETPPSVTSRQFHIELVVA